MDYTICDRKLIIGTGATEICYTDIFDVIIGNDLDEVQLPPTIRVIHDNTFFDFSGVKGINIPNSVQHIGSQAFWGLDDLKELTLPVSVPFIGKHAFLQLHPIDADNSWKTNRYSVWLGL